MPKIRFDKKAGQYNKVVQNTNCKQLISDMHILVDRYLDVLSLEEKKQLLYIARMIEAAQGQKLPPVRYHGYAQCVNYLLRRCRGNRIK